MPVVCDLTGQDFIGNPIHPGIVATLIGQLGNLRKDTAANLIHRAMHTSHSHPSILQAFLHFMFQS